MSVAVGTVLVIESGRVPRAPVVVGPGRAPLGMVNAERWIPVPIPAVLALRWGPAPPWLALAVGSTRVPGAALVVGERSIPAPRAAAPLVGSAQARREMAGAKGVRVPSLAPQLAVVVGSGRGALRRMGDVDRCVPVLRVAVLRVAVLAVRSGLRRAGMPGAAGSIQVLRAPAGVGSGQVGPAAAAAARRPPVLARAAPGVRRAGVKSCAAGPQGPRVPPPPANGYGSTGRGPRPRRGGVADRAGTSRATGRPRRSDCHCATASAWPPCCSP